MRLSSAAAVVFASVLSTLGGCVVTPGYSDYPQDYPPADAAPPASDAPAVDYDGSLDEANDAPPPIPDYDQPPCPVEGYLWTPGLWQWGPAGYFWVPGVWVAPPAIGLLWTPGYWALSGARYVFHPGYWGRHVGYYGGINYGHGYFGSGYAGGRWENNAFTYNRAVSNVGDRFRHVYDQRTLGRNKVDVDEAARRPRTGYAGGPGTRLAPNARELDAARDPHVPATLPQIQEETQARSNPQLNAARNQGRPPVAALPAAGAFGGPGVTAAKPGPAYSPRFQPPSQAGAPGPQFAPSQPGSIQHARDLPRPESFTPAPAATAGQGPVSGPAGGSQAAGPQGGSEQAFLRAQSDLRARQEQQRQALALQQEQEHRSFAAQPAHDPQAFGAMEQRHQQQSQQLQQRQQQEIRQFIRQPGQQKQPQQQPNQR